MGDSVFQSCGRKKKILWGKQGMSASVPCPVGAGVPPKLEQAGAVWVCAGVEKVYVWAWCVRRQGCVCVYACVCVHLCVFVNVQAYVNLCVIQGRGGRLRTLWEVGVLHSRGHRCRRGELQAGCDQGLGR